MTSSAKLIRYWQRIKRIPPNFLEFFPTLATGTFTEWREQSLAFLSSTLGEDHRYTRAFAEKVTAGYHSNVNAGIGILRALRQDVEAGRINSEMPVDAVAMVTTICSRFHAVAMQLRERREGRPTLDVNDEYDVQDLLHGLLRLHFDDVRAEEVTPSYAGSSARMDFLLKNEKVVVEAKKTRVGLTRSAIANQLIEDMARYKRFTQIAMFLCALSTTPKGRIANPRGLESDLSTIDAGLRVIVMVTPRSY